MKGYTVFLLIIASLLLLLPLPALPRSQAAASPPAEESSTPVESTHSTPTNSNDAPTDAPTFKVLTDGKVTELTCREFLIRTLAYEMSPTYHAEALKAQAVAAYTYHGRRKNAQTANPDPALCGAHFEAPDDTFPQDFTADKLRERWGDKFDEYYANLCAAVDAVTGNYMTYRGEWIDACYFAMSNGTTEDAKTVWGHDVPYLRSVASPDDKNATKYETTVTLTAEQVKTAFAAAEPTLTLDSDPSAWFGKPTLSAAGTVASIPVGDKTLAGTAVRAALELRSATFSVNYADGGFTFTVRGYGHGVGLSQVGANALAKKGYTWQEILQYYYTGISIV